MEQEIVINLIGTGYDVNIGPIQPDIAQRLSLKAESKTEPENYYQLFDLDFYRINKFTKNKLGDLLYSWKDINGDNNFMGPNFCERSQLEVWINGKRKRTLKIADLYAENALFPFYNIVEETIDQNQSEKQLLIGHQLKGLIAKYKFKTSYFNMDFLELSMLSFQHKESSYKILHVLKYRDTPLKADLYDSVVTGIIIKIL